MGRARLNLEAPPRFADGELARLDAMTPDDIERNAREDAENPPLTADELVRLRALPRAGPRHTVLDPHPNEKDRHQAGRPAYGRKLAGTAG